MTPADPTQPVASTARALDAHEAHGGPSAVLDAEALDALARRVAELVALTPFPPLVDADQAARLLRVPASWVLAEARANRIPCVRLGECVRFDP